jgi:hypothetical protein
MRWVSMDHVVTGVEARLRSAYNDYEKNLSEFLQRASVQQIIGDWNPESKDNKNSKDWLLPLFAVNVMQDIRDPSLRVLYEYLCIGLSNWKHPIKIIEDMRADGIINICRRIVWLTATSVNVSRWVHMRARVAQHHPEMNSVDTAIKKQWATHTQTDDDVAVVVGADTAVVVAVVVGADTGDVVVADNDVAVVVADKVADNAVAVVVADKVAENVVVVADKVADIAGAGVAVVETGCTLRWPFASSHHQVLFGVPKCVAMIGSIFLLRLKPILLHPHLDARASREWQRRMHF